MTSWTVLLDVPLRRLLETWDVRARMRLDALQRLIMEGGPAALDWDARKLTGFPSWEDLTGSYRGDIWLSFSGDCCRPRR